MRDSSTGTLYVVATPIGHLGDMVPRAVEVLQSVGLIAAEDTRSSKVLLDHFGIATKLRAYHDHNEDAASDALLVELQQGQNIALISDAGTPLISDPGYRIVAKARSAGITVSPIPGACAMVAALSVSGMPTDKFIFEGFLSAKGSHRRQRLEQLSEERRTMIFYESKHRLVDTVKDMAGVLGGSREVVLAREITKLHETITALPLSEMADWLLENTNRIKGESVLVLAGAPETEQRIDSHAVGWLVALAQELAPKKAASIVSKQTGVPKKQLYDWLLDNK